MSKAYIGLFPGQGSQKVGMGKELAQHSRSAKEMLEQADLVLGFKLSEICFNGPDEKLLQTEIVQPAILTVSSICFELFKSSAGYSGLQAAAGHSLGEYSALVAAGAIEFTDAVLLVHKRGKYMQAAVPQGAGKMLAVLGKEVEEIESLLSEVDGIAEIANINAPGQIVISGAAAAMEQAKEKLADTRVIELAVSAPFHCSLMKPAAEKLALDLDQLPIKPANFPVFANVSAQPLQEPEEIRQALKDQVCGKVRWVESMERALTDYPGAEMIEFGAGGVLIGLMKRINKEVLRHNISTMADLDDKF